MIFSMKNEDLLKGLAPLVMLSKLGMKGTKPLLSHIRIETTLTHIFLNASDLERFLMRSIENPNGNCGACTVHGKNLYDLLETFPKGSNTTIELVDRDRILVKNGRSKFYLSTANPALFPMFEIPMEGFSPIHPKCITDAIDITEASLSDKDEARPYLECILFEASEEEGFMRAVAVDGHKLTSCKIPGILRSRFLLHKSSFPFMHLLLKGQQESEIYLTERYVMFKGKDWVFSTRLLDDRKFPEYQKVIGKKTRVSFVFDKTELKKAVERCCMLTDDKRAVVFTLEEGTLKISSSSQAGSGQEEVTIAEGENVKTKIVMGFNGDYLVKLLSKFKGEKITAKMGGSLDPMVLTENTNFFSILLPVRL